MNRQIYSFVKDTYVDFVQLSIDQSKYPYYQATTPTYNLPLVLTIFRNVKSKWKTTPTFLAFSENLNFILRQYRRHSMRQCHQATEVTLTLACKSKKGPVWPQACAAL